MVTRLELQQLYNREIVATDDWAGMRQLSIDFPDSTSLPDRAKTLNWLRHEGKAAPVDEIVLADDGSMAESWETRSRDQRLLWSRPDECLLVKQPEYPRGESTYLITDLKFRRICYVSEKLGIPAYLNIRELDNDPPLVLRWMIRAKNGWVIPHVKRRTVTKNSCNDDTPTDRLNTFIPLMGVGLQIIIEGEFFTEDDNPLISEAFSRATQRLGPLNDLRLSRIPKGRSERLAIGLK